MFKSKLLTICWYGYFDKLNWRVRDWLVCKQLLKTYNKGMFNKELQLIPFQEGFIKVSRERRFDEHQTITFFGRRTIQMSMTRFIACCNDEAILLEQDPKTLAYKRLLVLNLDTGNVKVLFEEKEWPVTLAAFLSFDSRYVIMNRVKAESVALYCYNLKTKKLQLLHSDENCFAYADHCRNRFIICSNRDGRKERIFYKLDNCAAWNLLYDTGENEEILECNVLGKNAELCIVVYNQFKKQNECVLLDGTEIARIRLESLLSTVEGELQEGRFVVEERQFSGKMQFIVEKNGILKQSMQTRDTKITIETRFTKSDIPITLVQGNVTKAIICEVYGSYGETNNSADYPWIHEAINRGFAYAYCHARGGREKGWKWYAEGRGRAKQNSIQDAQECIEYLRDVFKGLPITLYGFSAGAWIVSNCCTQHPDWFRCVILDRGLLDLTKYRKDYRDIPLSAIDEEEFGLVSFASDLLPQENIPSTHTKVLVAAMTNDKRIPFKYTFSWFLKAKRKNPNTFLLIDRKNGHNFDSQEALNRHQLRILAFILNHGL